MMASRCQRSILSCARCRRRKMKCDRQLPSCSQCVTAKTDCTGISAATKGDVPRSIVLNLESEIARLETELAKTGQLDALNATDILVQMPISQHEGSHAPDLVLGVSNATVMEEETFPANMDLSEPVIVTVVTSEEEDKNCEDLRASILSSKPIQSMIAATLPCGSGATDLLSRVRMGMTPSSARVVGDRQRINSTVKASKGSSQLRAQVLRNVPVEIVQRLLRKYLSTIHPENPFLDAASLWHQFNHVSTVLGWSDTETTIAPATADDMEPVTVVPHHDFLVVYLVLAISVTLGSTKGGHEARCMALSASLFEEGIQHLYILPVFPSDIAWLQTILLVLLYATILPRSANVWILSGAAMRACLELGLHRENPASTMGLDATQLDLRRKVFWSAYSMERSICSALQRPLSTPDAAINTKFPAAEEQGGAFLGSIHYHQLLSEMIHVHFQGEKLADGLEWDDWVAEMDRKLRGWYATHHQQQRDCSHHHNDINEFSLARGLMILHRPSPRTPMPSQQSLLIAFEAAASSARTHQEHIRSGFFRRPWLSAQYTLEAAMIVLFCLRHGCDTIRDRFSAPHIFEMTKLFTLNFLSISAQGWPEVSNYAGVYERLLGPLLESVFSTTSSQEGGRSSSVEKNKKFGPAQDAELMRMLYPGPAHLEKLRFGGMRQQEQFSPFDFSLFTVDDEELVSSMLGPMAAGRDGALRWDLAAPGVDDFGTFFTSPHM